MLNRIKIKGKDELELISNFQKVMNIGFSVCSGGQLPRAESSRGMFWSHDIESNIIDLYPKTNNYRVAIKKDIRKEGENEIEIEFLFRYDTDGAKAKALINVLMSFLDDTQVELSLGFLSQKSKFDYTIEGYVEAKMWLKKNGYEDILSKDAWSIIQIANDLYKNDNKTH